MEKASDQIAKDQDGRLDSNSLSSSDKSHDQEVPGILAHDSPVIRLSYRVLDIIVSSSVLVFSLPLMLVIALLIRLDSPGPALFWQTRMTKNRRLLKVGTSDNKDRRGQRMTGRPFKFLKFRTMYIDARERFPELYRYDYDENVLMEFKFKVTNDPRVTRMGSWLRKTSLDELPNFWNVLTGDMTLVGPRPEIPEMSRYYEGEYLRKFDVNAGITGPAQVEGRGHLSFKETITHDLNYVKNRSIINDIKLLIKTIKAVVLGKGAF